MNEIHARLAEADPLRLEDGLSPEDAARMRTQMLAAAATVPGHAPFFWPRALAVAAALILMIAAGIVAGRRMPPPEPVGADVPPALAVDPGEKRQLQFSTPGGTRIIWTLDPEFKVEGTLP